MKFILNWLFALNYGNALKRGWGGNQGYTPFYNTFNYLFIDFTFILSYPLFILFVFLGLGEKLTPGYKFILYISIVGILVQTLIFFYYKRNKYYLNLVNLKVKKGWLLDILNIIIKVIGILLFVQAVSMTLGQNN